MPKEAVIVEIDRSNEIRSLIPKYNEQDNWMQASWCPILVTIEEDEDQLIGKIEKREGKTEE